ncbi:hypothetical protein EYF80_058839 [Liparis tanakae]|uniref:Uncharacterized protein n=1 Tax=Liparis tanakae TaxID=230148 RepID=A0A4Z2EQ19_9TELE|nr:hypothetical protein EYF80_058839 [Liparis tanakae]
MSCRPEIMKFLRGGKERKGEERSQDRAAQRELPTTESNGRQNAGVLYGNGLANPCSAAVATTDDRSRRVVVMML